MSYIDVEECLAKIDESRINRYDDANVYVGADKTSMTVGFAYSQKMEDEFTIIRFTKTETELTDEIWQECLALSSLIENKYKVERIVDDAREIPNIEESFVQDALEVAPVTVTYQLDRGQRLRLQRLTDAFNDFGMEYSIEDTMQAMMSSFADNDINKNLFFYEDLLLEKGEKSDV